MVREDSGLVSTHNPNGSSTSTTTSTIFNFGIWIGARRKAGNGLLRNMVVWGGKEVSAYRGAGVSHVSGSGVPIFPFYIKENTPADSPAASMPWLIADCVAPISGAECVKLTYSGENCEGAEKS